MDARLFGRASSILLPIIQGPGILNPIAGTTTQSAARVRTEKSIRMRTWTRFVPHESLGADCCGCIVPVIRGDEADLVCNECDAVIRTVPANEAEQALAQLAPSNEICSATCPRCGALNVFPGFSAMHAFTCGSAAKA